MCLDLKEGQRKRASIAEKDIKVFKMLVRDGRKLVSPYQFTEYKLNKLYESKLVKEVREHEYGGYSVNRGLHAFVNLEYAKFKIQGNNSRAIYNAIIPKGSMYYLGNNNDIVSNQLKVTRKVK